MSLVVGTLGGNLLEFVTTFLVWVSAERLGLSAVMCVVAFAMTIARSSGLLQPPRVRVHSFAVWETIVFLLNVLAFLLMGMQARSIVGGMDRPRLIEAAHFAAIVAAAVVGIRLVWVLVYNRLAANRPRLRGDVEPANWRHGVVVGWCGMRGLLTLATAFALPAAFPQRDLIVLTAFSVVLATLVLQGLTLAPLVRWLRLGEDDGTRDELATARRKLAKVAFDRIGDDGTAMARHLRESYRVEFDAVADPPHPQDAKVRRKLGLAAIRAQRETLELLRRDHTVGPDSYMTLQEELDWKELAITSEDERQIEEI